MPIDMKQTLVDQKVTYPPFDPTSQLPPWWGSLTQVGKDTYVESMLKDMSQDEADLLDEIRDAAKAGILSPPTVLDSDKNSLQNERHAYTNWWNYNKGLAGKPAETEMDMIFAWYAHLKSLRQRLANAKAVKEAIERFLGGSSGALLPNGTRIGGGVHTGPGAIGGIGGAPSLPGYGGGLLGSLGGNRSGRGPGGSQFMPGIGFFPGAGIGPGGVGHGVGGIGLGGDEPRGPWTGGGLAPSKHSSGGTGRQPGTGGGTKKGAGSGYSETGSKGGGDRVTGSDVDLSKVGKGPTTGDTTGDERSAAQTSNQDMKGMAEYELPTSSGGDGTIEKVHHKDGSVEYRWVPLGGSGERPSDDGGGGGADEGPPIHKGGPYFTPHGGSTGLAMPAVGMLPTAVTRGPTSYLHFTQKGVGTGEGWGGNNPVVTPAIKPSDLFKPADDSIGPYNPKGTDYRPAPDDPSPGGPAGAAGRATRVRVG